MSDVIEDRALSIPGIVMRGKRKFVVEAAGGVGRGRDCCRRSTPMRGATRRAGGNDDCAFDPRNDPLVDAVIDDTFMSAAGAARTSERRIEESGRDFRKRKKKKRQSSNGAARN